MVRGVKLGNDFPKTFDEARRRAQLEMRDADLARQRGNYGQAANLMYNAIGYYKAALVMPQKDRAELGIRRKIKRQITNIKKLADVFAANGDILKIVKEVSRTNTTSIGLDDRRILEVVDDSSDKTILRHAKRSVA